MKNMRKPWTCSNILIKCLFLYQYLFLGTVSSDMSTTHNCPRNSYWDPGTESCHPCEDICPSRDDTCQRVCPELSCRADQFWDRQTLMCRSCQEVCNSVEDCRKICPGYVTNNVTTTTDIPNKSSPSSPFPNPSFGPEEESWHNVVWIVAGVVCFSVICVTFVILHRRGYFKSSRRCNCMKDCESQSQRADENKKPIPVSDNQSSACLVLDGDSTDHQSYHDIHM